jgi:DNA-binding MarR family transcriptional regulator/GNAT superfamily N-acetyltransferase
MVDQVRRFNRTVTQRVGALDDHYLSRNRPLGEARVLWEIGTEGAEVRALRARLALDSGHLSRLLRALERDGMVTVAADPADRRVRRATLTAKGRKEFATIDRSSDELATSLLEPLTDRQRDRLVSAMGEVERLLTAASVEFRVVDPAHPDARQCLRAYVAELNRRWPAGFDPSKGSTAEPHEVRPPHGLFLVAYLREEPVACGGLKHHPGGKTDLKRMWVSDDVRGLGLGRRLLERLEAEAAAAGATTARMETNRVLTEAIALYESAGYREVPAFNDEPFAHHWFEKRLRPSGGRARASRARPTAGTASRRGARARASG